MSSQTVATCPPPDWREQIALAEAAREFGRKLREGKPASFRPSAGFSRGYGSSWRAFDPA